MSNHAKHFTNQSLQVYFDGNAQKALLSKLLQFRLTVFFCSEVSSVLLSSLSYSSTPFQSIQCQFRSGFVIPHFSEFLLSSIILLITCFLQFLTFSQRFLATFITNSIAVVIFVLFLISSFLMYHFDYVICLSDTFCVLSNLINFQPLRQTQVSTPSVISGLLIDLYSASLYLAFKLLFFASREEVQIFFDLSGLLIPLTSRVL